MRIPHRAVDRLLTLGAILAIPVLGVTMWRTGQSSWEWLREYRHHRARRALADSIIVYDAGRSLLGRHTTGTDVLIEFTDYQCPACRGAGPYVDSALVAGEGHAVLILHLPLNIHPSAKRLAAAAICAEAEGKFTEMHRILLAMPPDSSQVALRQAANGAGIQDMEQFLSCLDQRATLQRINRDIEFARRLSVSGTPTFVTSNGRLLDVADLLTFAGR